MADLLIDAGIRGGKETYKSLIDIGKAAEKAASSIDSFQNAIRKIEQPRSIQDYQRELDKLNKELKDSQKEIKNLKDEISNLNKGIKIHTSDTKKASDSNSSFGKTLKTVRAAAIGYATVLATMEIQQFITGTIQAGVQLDSLNQSFKAITGSTFGAEEQMRFVAKTANDLGLELTALESSYKDILAASKNTSLEGEQIQKVFLSINKAAAVLGMSSDDVQGSLRALSQMISKGNVQAEELRGQLGERLPGAFNMAAEAMGVTTQKLNDMLENGDVLATDLVPKLADVLENRFGKAAVDAADRAQASFNRFYNSITRLQRIIGDTGLTGALAELADYAQSKLQQTADDIESNSRDIQKSFEGIEQSIEKVYEQFNKPEITNILEGISEGIQAVGNVASGLVNLYNSLPDAMHGGIIVGLLGLYNPVLGIAAGLAALLPKFTDFVQGLSALERGGITFADFFGDADEFKLALESYQKGMALIKSETDLGSMSVEELQIALKTASTELQHWQDKPFSFYSDDNELKLKNIEYFSTLIGKIQSQIGDTEPLELFYTNIKKIFPELDNSIERSSQKAKNSYIYSGKWYDDYVAKQQELNWYIEKSQSDNLTQQEMKAVKAKEKEYKKLIDLYGSNSDDQQKLEKALEKEILKIKEDYSKKRQKLKQKELQDNLKQEEQYLKDLQKSNQEKYKTDISLAENMAEDSWLIFAKGQEKAIKIHEDTQTKLTENEYEESQKRLKQAEKDAEELAEKIQDAYDDLYDDVKDFTRDVIDDWDDMGNTLIDMTENMVKEIAAAFLAQNIVMPVVLSVGGALGLQQNGVGYGSILNQAQSSQNLGSILSGDMFSNAWGGVKSIGSLISTGMSSGVGAGSTLLSMGIPAADAAALSALPATFSSTIGTIGSAMSSILPVVGLAGTAFSILSSVFKDEPDPRMGFILGQAPSFVGAGEQTSSQFDYYPWLQDVDNREGIGDAVRTFFDAKFTAIEEAFNFSVSDAIATTSGKVIVNPEDYGGDIEKAILVMENEVFALLQNKFVEGLESGLSSLIPTRFFEDIALDGESAFDSFVRFGKVVEESSNFIGEFTRQLNEFGKSAVEAYNDLETIYTVLKTVDEAVSNITNTTTISNLEILDTSWNKLIDTLKEADATVEQIAKTEQSRYQILGANITGLTGVNIASNLTSGGDVSSILEGSITSLLAEVTATKIVDKYITPLNEKIGKAYSDTGGDIEAVLAVLSTYDLSELNTDIVQFQTQIDRLFDNMSSSLSDAEEALRKSISAEEDLLNARLSASESINSLITSLMGGDLSPVQSLEYFENRYADLIAGVTSATTADDLNKAVSELTSYIPEYLDFASAYGGDYNTLFNQITTDLQALDITQQTEAERQIEQLEYINNYLGNIDSSVTNIVSAFANYQKISGDYVVPIGFNDEDYIRQKTAALNAANSLGKSWTIEDTMAAFTEAGLSAAAHYSQYGQYEGFYGSYADGGVSYGPSSGYPVELHGKELIVPLDNPGNYTERNSNTNSPQQNFEVKVYIGNKELNDVVVKVIEVNSEAHDQIKRVANAR